MRGSSLRPFIGALCFLTAGCGDAREFAEDEDYGQATQELTTYAAANTWPVSNGVATVPYEIVDYDGASASGLSALTKADVSRALRYVENATNHKVHLVADATARSRVQLNRKPSWTTGARASCEVGRQANSPTVCTFQEGHIVAIAHRKDGSAKPIEVYFSDGTARQTVLDDLRAVAAENEPVKYPINPLTGVAYRPDEVSAIDFSGPGVIVWYGNGYTSKGTTLDLGATVAPRPFTRMSYWEPTSGAPRFAWMELLGVAITPNAGKAYAFWLDPSADLAHPRVLHTVGASSTDLVGNAAGIVVDAGDLAPESILGMVYDEQSNLNTYTRGRWNLGNRGVLQAIDTGKADMPSTAGFMTILHELTHGLGFAHEQQRKDRDDYVIDDSGKLNVSPFGLYDYSSVMQYDATRKQEGDSFPNNQLSYSWRDLRSILAQTGIGDPQESAATEAQFVAAWAAAAKMVGTQVVYSPATTRLPKDIVGLDIELDTGNLLTYYTSTDSTGSGIVLSRGTTYDLGRYSFDVPFSNSHPELINAFLPSMGGREVAPSDMLAIAHSDHQVLAWFKTSACASRVARSRGVLNEFESVWPAACVSLPAGYSADNIRDVARYRYAGVTRFITLYDDGTYSIGGSTGLDSDSQGTFAVRLPDEHAFDAKNVYGFAMRGTSALFFLGCESSRAGCSNQQFRHVEVPDFVSRLPVRFR